MKNAELVESNGTAARTPEGKAIFWDRKFQASYKSTIEAAWRCGRALQEVRKKQAHGQWMDWLQSAGISYTRANRCMALAGVELSRVLNFPSMTQALAAVSSVPRLTEVQSTATEKSRLKKASTPLKKPKAPTREEIEQLRERVSKLETSEKSLRGELQRSKRSVNQYKKALEEKNRRIEELEAKLAQTNGHIEKPHQAASPA